MARSKAVATIDSTGIRSVVRADDALRRERTDAADHYRRIIGSSVERIGDVSLQAADVGIRWRERC
jgi:hypothetical protein